MYIHFFKSMSINFNVSCVGTHNDAHGTEGVNCVCPEANVEITMKRIRPEDAHSISP